MNIYRFIIFFFLYTSCAFSQTLEKVSLQLHWKYQFEFAGFIAAREKGFYKEFGLDVELKEYKYGQNIVNEVLQKKSTYGVYNSNILKEYLQNQPLKLIASFYKKSALVLITKPELKYPSDLIDKKIMAAGYEDFALNFNNIFNIQDIDINTLQLIPHTFTVEPFAKGEVDAMTAFISDQPYKLDQLGINYNIIDPSNFGLFNLQMELFTSQDETKQHNKRTEKFKLASIKGWEYALENPNEIIEIILNKYNTQNLSRGFLEYEAMMTDRIILPKMYELGQIDKKFLIRQLDILTNTHNTSYEDKKELINDFIFLSKDERDIIESEKNYNLLLNLTPAFIVILLLISYRQWLLKKYNKKLELEVNEKTKEYKKKNQQLIDANNNFIDLFHTAIEAIGIFNEEFRLVEINLSGKKMYNCFDEAVLFNKTIYDFVPAHELKKVQEKLLQDKSEPYELDLYRFDGTLFPALASGKNIIRNDKIYRIITVVDLSQIKQRDQLIQEQSKLAQMGEMISMIAHQWRQPLSSISATSEALKLKTTLDTLDKDITLALVNDIKKYTNHLSETIDDFRNFYKKDKHKHKTSADQLVKKALGIVGASIEEKNVHIKASYDASSEIFTYQNEATQVILSLLQNAQDILLEKKVMPALIQIDTFENNDTIFIEIKDNGGGIPDEIIDKIFDPYFSTKSEKNGTGLGLYMSKIIIEDNCDGQLNVINKPPYVTFQIKFNKSNKTF